MTPFRRRLLLKCLEVLDIFIICISFAAATLVVFHQSAAVDLETFLAVRVKIDNLIFFMLFVLGGHVSYSSFGLYQSRRLSNHLSEIVDILKASALGSFTLWLSATVFHFILISPLFVAIFLISLTTLLVSSRLGLRQSLEWMRNRGRNLRHLLIVGTNSRAVQFAREVERRPELGYKIVGFVDNEWVGTGRFRQNGYGLITGFEGLKDYLRSHVVDEVVIDLPVKSLYQAASDVVASCEEQGIIVRYLPNLFSSNSTISAIENKSESPTVAVYNGLPDNTQHFLKRIMDIILSLTATVLLSPLFLIIALGIKLTSPGPVLFIQDRIGLNKRLFRLLKFRTMIPDAEKQQAELEAKNEMGGPVFKIKNDPRITQIGRILRKTSIDELPQLFNVLKGDMSLVGPRPLPVRDYEGFDCDWHRRRFSVRPGITCLWQINGRNNISFDQWMQLDMEYIDRWSLSLDLKVLAKTIPAVIKGAGAT